MQRKSSNDGNEVYMREGRTKKQYLEAIKKEEDIRGVPRKQAEERNDGGAADN